MLFLMVVTNLFATPEGPYSILTTYYPEHCCSGGNAVYLALLHTRLTEMHHACAIVGYAYITGTGSNRKMAKDCVIIYKIAGRIYLIDNRTMHPVEVPFSDVQAAIEFYWTTTLAEDFIQVKMLGYKANDYWYN